MNRRPKRLFLLASAIVAPAVVLAVLSWRSFGQERQERRGEVLRLASLRARAVTRELEDELQKIVDEAWRPVGSTIEEVAAAGGRGSIAAARTSGGNWIYPHTLDSDLPSLEHRLRRENPDLLPAFSAAVALEFGADGGGTAAERYGRLESEVESSGTRGALIHARARAAWRAGRQDEARGLYQRLDREYGDSLSESGLPYRVVAQSRLLQMEPTPERVAAFQRTLGAAGIPGHARVLLLREAAAGPAMADARALAKLEELILVEEPPAATLTRIDDRAYLLSVRALAGGRAGVAAPLEGFPRTALDERDGIACEAEGVGRSRRAGEVLLRQSSEVFPSLTVAARLVDPTRFDVPRHRWLLTGGILACLFAALGFGIVALLRTVREELALAQLKSDFVSGVSHQLKTPLTSIRMFAEMLEGGRVPAEEKRQEYFRLIHRETLRLSRLVENVLDFARIEEGRKTLSFAERPLRDVVAAAVETFRAQVDGQGVELRADLSEEPLTARVDADALQGAVLNLLDNALKYGGETRRIELVLARRGARAEVSVRDNGPGIPAGDRGRLFEKFFRGASAVSGPAGGAGLGLALVKHAAEAHGGSVSVESEIGKGSRFILSLPLCPVSSS